MPENFGDQAAGLRRLFGQQSTHVIAFVAGQTGVGNSLIVANLAAALARQGKEVLILDEHRRDGVASCFGALSRNDLYQVINGDKTISDVLLTVAPNIRILPVQKAIKKLTDLSADQQETFVERIAALDRVSDFVLVDASMDHPLGISPLGLAAHETVVVMSARSDAIKEAYALIKKISLCYARKNFRILVNKARGADEADAIYNNISHVSRSRGVASLQYAGFVPHDEHVRQASRLSQPVVGLFPECHAARAYRTIGGDILNWSAQGNAMGGVEQFAHLLLHLSRNIEPVAIYA